MDWFRYGRDLNSMFDELTEVMKGLTGVQVKAETYLEPTQASMMKLFCEYS